MRRFRGAPQPGRPQLSALARAAGAAEPSATDEGVPRIRVLQWVADFPDDWCAWMRAEHLGYQAEFLLGWLWQRVGLDGVLARSGPPWRPEELSSDQRRGKSYRAMAAELEAHGILRWTERGDPLVVPFTAAIDGRWPHNRPRTTIETVLAQYPELGTCWPYVDRHSLVTDVALRTLGRRDYLVVQLLDGPALHAQFHDVNRNGRYEACRQLAAAARPRAPYRPGVGRPPLAWRRNFRSRWVAWSGRAGLSFLEEGFLRWALLRANDAGDLARDDGQPWTLADFADEYGVEPRKLRKIEGAIAGLRRRHAITRRQGGTMHLEHHADLPQGRFPHDADVVQRRALRPASYRQGGLF